MKKIPLSLGMYAIVDDADFENLSKYKWFAAKRRNTFYAVRNYRKPDGSYTAVLMHRQILGLNDRKIHADHRDGNGLNNQRSNLRACTNAQNSVNHKKSKANTSGFIGVSYFKRDNKWRAYVCDNGKFTHLGYFESIIDAAKAHDDAVKNIRGEFAKTNF